MVFEKGLGSSIASFMHLRKITDFKGTWKCIALSKPSQ